MKFQKFSFYPAYLADDVERMCFEMDTTVIRNVRFMGKTTAAICNVAPKITDKELSWLKQLRYSPGNCEVIPSNVEEFHAYYWLAINTCCDDDGVLQPSGTPINLVGVYSVTIKKGVINNVAIV